MPNTNLVFVMTDHQRADSIHMIQDGKAVTPNLNKLASEATEFTNAYNSCPLCVPARTALATGKNPIKSGMILNDVPGRIAQDHKTIHEYYAELGYEVAHVGVHHIRVKPDLKERVNFKLWIDEDDYLEYAKAKGITISRTEADTVIVDELQEGNYEKKKYSNARITMWNNDFEDFKDIYFTRKAKEFIEGEHTKPFALFLYLWAPHPPLNIPEPYASMFNSENLTLPQNIGVIADGEPEIRRKGVAAQMAEGITSQEWKKIWSTHLGLVNMADNAIGSLMDVLEEKNLMNNTTVVFTSDHGEHLGQHSMYQKMEMYDQAIKVPAIIKVPSGKAQVIDTPIAHIDFLPTLIDLVGVKPDQELEGTSLKDILLGGKVTPKRDVFSVYCGNQKTGDTRRAIVSGKYKYIYDTVGTPELYDLEADSLEMKNLALNDSHSVLKQELHKKLAVWGRKNNDYIIY